MIITPFAMNAFFVLAIFAVGHCALLGSNKCTYGPSYWCRNVSHAFECNAIQHCLAHDWRQNTMKFQATNENCKYIAKLLQYVLPASDTKKDDEQTLIDMANLCSKLPADKRSECKKLMAYPDQLLHLLSSDLAPETLASVFNLCIPQSHEGSAGLDMVPKAVDVSSDCTDCTKFLSDVRDRINKSSGEIVKMVKSMVCDRMPDPMDKICNSVVDDYYSMIFSFVYQQLDPTNVCTLIGFCSENAAFPVLNNLKHDNAICPLCKDLVANFMEYLKNTTVQKEILDTAEKLCHKLPGTLSDECGSYVAEYGQMTIDFVLDELSQVDICSLLKLCSNADNEVMRGMLSQKTMDMCEVCKDAATYVKMVLSDKAIQDEISLGLEKLCSFLPNNYSNECTKVVSAYLPLVFEIIVNELDPSVACQALGLCSSGGRLAAVRYGHADGLVHVHIDAAIFESGLCDICESIMSQLEGMLDSHATKEEITGALDKVCRLLPDEVSNECTSFVNEYTNVIIDALVGGLTPRNVCKYLKLCASKNFEKMQPGSILVNSLSSKPLTYITAKNGFCHVCTDSVRYIQRGLATPGSQPTVESLLGSVCSIVPADKRNFCNMMVSVNEPSLLNLLQQYNDDPDKICKMLGCQGTGSPHHDLKFVPFVALQPALRRIRPGIPAGL